jgi:peptidyl-prolyl cis-trans isomerase SurA
MKKIIRLLLPGIFVLSLNSVSAQVDSSLVIIKQIQTRLNQGADFCEMARIYSEDTQSKLNCGDIGYFGRGELMRGYEDAMVKLKIGQVSDIVQTGYGYHIIQLVGVEKKKYATRHILIKYR